MEDINNHRGILPHYIYICIYSVAQMYMYVYIYIYIHMWLNPQHFLTIRCIYSTIAFLVGSHMCGDGHLHIYMYLYLYMGVVQNTFSRTALNRSANRVATAVPQ